MLKVSFKIIGDRELANTFRRLSSDWGAIVTLRALADLNVKLMATLNTLFRPSVVAKGQLYAHGYTGSYLSGIMHKIDQDSLDIYETSQKGGIHIRRGTGPGPVDQNGNPIISDEVVEWAKRKLGVDEGSARRIARSVAMHGIGWPGGTSPLPREKPVGERRFAYADWIVTERNRSDLESLAKKVGVAIVTYLER